MSTTGKWDAMTYRELEGWWTDAGTIGSLHRAATLVSTDRGNPVLTRTRPAADERRGA
jgi:hypothetical protein